MWMNLNIMQTEESSFKDHMLYNSICMKCPEQANTERQSRRGVALGWMEMGCGKRGMTAKRYGVSFGGDENILDLYSGDGCTTLNILKTIELYMLSG